MALISCPECEEKISDTAKTCPHCGYRPRAKKAVGQSWTGASKVKGPGFLKRNPALVKAFITIISATLLGALCFWLSGFIAALFAAHLLAMDVFNGYQRAEALWSLGGGYCILIIPFLSVMTGLLKKKHPRLVCLLQFLLIIIVYTVLTLRISTVYDTIIHQNILPAIEQWSIFGDTGAETILDMNRFIHLRLALPILLLALSWTFDVPRAGRALLLQMISVVLFALLDLIFSYFSVCYLYAGSEGLVLSCIITTIIAAVTCLILRRLPCFKKHQQ